MKRLFTLAAYFTALFCFSQTDEIDRLTIELAYQKQDTTKVKTSLKLIESLYDTANYKKALLYIDQTDQLSETLNYTYGMAETNFFRALIYSKEEDYVNAMDNFNKSKQFYLKINNKLGIAKVNNNIGLIEIKRGNYEQGLRNSMLAIQVFEEENRQQELSLAYNNLAEAYYKTSQIDKALEYNFKALNARENIEDLEGIKLTTKNIGILYSIKKQHSKAIEYFEKVLELMDPDNDSVLSVEILPRIGDEYLQLKEYRLAGQYLVQALKISRRLKNTEGIIRALNSIGNLNSIRGEIRLANNQLNEAYRLAKDTEFKTEILKNYRLHKELDSARGYYQNAFFWQGKYFELKEEIENENNKDSFSTDNLELESLPDEPNPVVNINKSENTDEKSFKRIKYLAYALGSLLFISIIFLVLLLIQRKSIETKSAGFIKENRELTLQNNAYYEQMQDLEEINKVKDRLFSIVSHDLKDSISSIKGFIDLLKEDSISREEFYDLVPELSENANNASLLLYNLLNWSKSQMQKLKPNPELFNIQEVFRSKMQLVEQKAEEKRIVIIDESQREFIYADKSMIEIVIQNLITNAVKFSRVGDIITISNKDTDGNSLITIEDTGVGISEDNLTKLFKKDNFTTIGTKNEKGTGLGLVICKELVELNNGEISVESNQNVGTKFL